ncbi:hypothetical protein L484_004755 [Morus notabilis]|uniref:Uncharacterized protein n=1 Tax=Morus notabilis TaxID=981085 RepID=W9QV31_9ROSA|nr:hypothetical protein L484_004755 [Morus notabilis]
MYYHPPTHEDHHHQNYGSRNGGGGKGDDSHVYNTNPKASAYGGKADYGFDTEFIIYSVA